MPEYTYKCDTCGEVITVNQRIPAEGSNYVYHAWVEKIPPEWIDPKKGNVYLLDGRMCFGMFERVWKAPHINIIGTGKDNLDRRSK